MTVILYALLLAHLNSYKVYYANIGIDFAITYVIKRLIRSIGAKDESDIIGVGGYTLTIGEFSKLLSAIKGNGFQGNDKVASQEFVGGVIGKMLESAKDMMINK